MYEVIRDATLPHQIILSFNMIGSVVVSCNCRRKSVRGGPSYEPMGPAPCFTEAQRLYNDPSNHVEAIGYPGTDWAGLRVEFGEEWKINGERSQSI